MCYSYIPFQTTPKNYIKSTHFNYFEMNEIHTKKTWCLLFTKATDTENENRSCKTESTTLPNSRKSYSYRVNHTTLYLKISSTMLIKQQID